MPTKPEPPQIESLKFSELTVDLLYSGRSKKEINDNAKELAPQLDAGWDSAQPGQYFIGEDGKKYLCAGFTRTEAAKIKGHKSGYFVKSEGDSIFHLTTCIRTNTGKPISPKAKGDLFKLLAEGKVADDFAGAVFDPKNAKDWKRAPMTLEQIAELPGIGVSAEWVRQCIVLAESSPEVGALLEDGAVSAPVVIKAKAIAKEDDGKQLRLLKKAVQLAKADGKDKATMQHLDAAKAELFPPKLIADDGMNGVKPTKSADKPEKDAGEALESKEGPSSEPSEDGPAISEETQTELITQDFLQVMGKDDPKAALIAIIIKWGDDTDNAMKYPDAQKLADRILEAKLPI